MPGALKMFEGLLLGALCMLGTRLCMLGAFSMLAAFSMLGMVGYGIPEQYQQPDAPKFCE